MGIEPRAVRLFPRRIVLVGMPVGALALQVVLGRGHLCEGRYHGKLFRIGVVFIFMTRITDSGGLKGSS